MATISRKNRVWLAIALAMAISSLGWAAPAPKLNCVKNGKIRYLDEKPHKIEAAAYCANQEQIFLLSDNCPDLKKCEVIKERHLKKAAKNIAGAIGNPTHHQCRLAGGTPRVTEVQVGEKWWSTGLCKFSDGSFAGIETWVSHWVRFDL